MRSVRFLLLFISVLLAGKDVFAQPIEDPASWSYELKKKSATEYQLIFHLDLKKGWHIWSLNPGGDGYEIVPSVAIDPNAMVKTKGKLTEKGQATTTKMEGIDGKVTYLSGKIDYIQDVTVTGKTKITGKHTYQVCNDRMCLPPRDKDFTFEIR